MRLDFQNVTVTAEVHADASGALGLSATSLRELVRDARERLKAAYPFASDWRVTMVMACDQPAREKVRRLDGFVSAALFHSDRTDFGRWECFRFKWKH